MSQSPARPKEPYTQLSLVPVSSMRFWAKCGPDLGTTMKDFGNASFAPGLIGIMQKALEQAIASLPHPVSSAHVQSMAETILRSAKDGEQNPATLTTMALLELQITPRE